MELVEKHIRNVGDHLVFVESVRPKWRRHDIIEIGSDLNQLYAHMEVSNYQQN